MSSIDKLTLGSWLIPARPTVSRREAKWYVIDLTRRVGCQLLDTAEWLEKVAHPQVPGMCQVMYDANMLFGQRSIVRVYTDHAHFRRLNEAAKQPVVGDTQIVPCAMYIPAEMDLSHVDLSQHRLTGSHCGVAFAFKRAGWAQVITEGGTQIPQLAPELTLYRGRASDVDRSIAIPIALIKTSIEGTI